ncbi:MAG: FixH family protein [Nitrospirae bacterium]|nr:FixH family protein [Nitrospirota bacterium]MBF0542283.1 FixH family protein [Nitrospirota bacterium]
MKNYKIIFILLPLLIFGCSSNSFDKTTDKGLFKVQLILNSGGLKTGRNKGSLKLIDSKGKPVDGAAIEITPWMPKMEHGVMLVPQVTDNGKGSYSVTDIFISMKGGWELQVSIKIGANTPNPIIDNVKFEFPDVQ